jgi:hypothetical protein
LAQGLPESEVQVRLPVPEEVEEVLEPQLVLALAGCVLASSRG